MGKNRADHEEMFRALEADFAMESPTDSPSQVEANARLMAADLLATVTDWCRAHSSAVSAMRGGNFTLTITIPRGDGLVNLNMEYLAGDV